MKANYDVKLTPKAEKEYAEWQKLNRNLAQKIDDMLVEMEQDPRKH
jgi:Txe/YoeB family toxin of Txe-Axe toxin-antitoxin module